MWRLLLRISLPAGNAVLLCVCWRECRSSGSWQSGREGCAGRSVAGTPPRRGLRPFYGLRPCSLCTRRWPLLPLPSGYGGCWWLPGGNIVPDSALSAVHCPEEVRRTPPRVFPRGSPAAPDRKRAFSVLSDVPWSFRAVYPGIRCWACPPDTGIYLARKGVWSYPGALALPQGQDNGCVDAALGSAPRCAAHTGLRSLPHNGCSQSRAGYPTHRRTSHCKTIGCLPCTGH